MAFISTASFRKNGGSNGTAGRDTVSFSHDLGGKGKGGKQRTSVRVRIGEQFIKEARWQHGDRIEFLFDPDDGVGLLRRVKSGGYSLSRYNRGASYCIQATWYPGMPSVPRAAECDGVYVTDEGLMFRFPDETSFTENVRRES